MRRKSIPPFAALFVLSSAFAASAGKFSATIDGVKFGGADSDSSFVQNRAEILSINAFVGYSADLMKIVVDSFTAARPDTFAENPRHPPFSCNSFLYAAKCSPE